MYYYIVDTKRGAVKNVQTSVRILMLLSTFRLLVHPTLSNGCVDSNHVTDHAIT